MERNIKCISEKYLKESLEFLEEVFSEHNNADEGKTVRTLVEEIRSKAYYLPELELIMTDENELIIGYALFSRFHIEGKYQDQLLMLTPVAAKTKLQRQHISKELIEYGFTKAIEMGYKAILVEGNPANYRSRGFVTSANYGILPGETVHVPTMECLMVKELVTGALEGIKGKVEYDFYDTLT